MKGSTGSSAMPDHSLNILKMDTVQILNEIKDMEVEISKKAAEFRSCFISRIKFEEAKRIYTELNAQA